MKDIVFFVSFDSNWQFLCSSKGCLVSKTQESYLVQGIRRIWNKFPQENLEKNNQAKKWVLEGTRPRLITIIAFWPVDFELKHMIHLEDTANMTQIGDEVIL